MFNRSALSNVGNYVYGWGAIALGVVGLVWGDFAEVWQPIQAFGNVPHRQALAYIAAVWLVLGGALMQSRRTALGGALALSIIYFVLASFWLPRVIRYPRLFGTWAGFTEQFSLVAAAMVAYASLAPRHPAWALKTAQAGRLLFGICVVFFGLSHLFAISDTANMVPKWIPPGQRFWAIATGVAHLMAGAAILSGVLAAPASRLLTVMLVSFGVLVWAPALFTDPKVHLVWAGNAINLALTAGAWVVADGIANQRGSTAIP